MDEYSSSWGVLYTAPAEVPRGDEPQLPAFLTCLMTYFLSASFPPPSHFLVPPLPETISWMNYFTSHSCFREQNLRQYECRAEGETHTHKHTHTDTLFQSFTKVKIWHIILDTVSMHVIDLSAVLKIGSVTNQEGEMDIGWYLALSSEPPLF